MPAKTPSGGGGRGAMGSLPRSTGRMPSTRSTKPVRLTKRGKAVAGGASAVAVAATGKKVNDFYSNRAKAAEANYKKLAAGYKGSAAQRAGQTENDYVQAKIKAQKLANKAKLAKTQLKRKGR